MHVLRLCFYFNGICERWGCYVLSVIISIGLEEYGVRILQVRVNFPVRSCKSPIGRLLRWRIGESTPDMVGTGEIKYPGWTGTSTAPRQFDIELSRKLPRKSVRELEKEMPTNGYTSSKHMYTPSILQTTRY
jgi:hypothetical protein